MIGSHMLLTLVAIHGTVLVGSADALAQGRPDCLLDFTVLNDLDAEAGTAAGLIEGISRYFSAKMSKLQLSWALEEYENESVLPASALFGGRGHLFEVVIAEGPGGLPYQLVVIEHHGAAKTPEGALTSSYLTDRFHAAPSDPLKVSDRSFFLWYYESKGQTKTQCITIAAKNLRTVAQRRAAQIRKLDKSLQGRIETRARAGQWQTLAAEAIKTVDDNALMTQINGLETRRLQIDQAWEMADKALQRELERQQRLRSDAGFIAIMQVALSAGQLYSSLQSQPNSSTLDDTPQLSPSDTTQVISSKINGAIIQSGNRITKIRTEITEYEERTRSIEEQLRNKYRGIGTPTISIP